MVNGNVDGNSQGPVYRLLLVEMPTGQIVTAPVAWPPFLQALHRLCAELRQIELLYESEVDESAALFWRSPTVLCYRQQDSLDWFASVDAPELSLYATEHTLLRR